MVLRALVRMAVIEAAQLGDPVDLRGLFGPDRAEFCRLLTALGPADWPAPTVCPGWSVADIAAHVLGDDLGRLASGRDGSTSTGPRSGESLPTFLDRHNEEWVQACRHMTPAELIEQLTRSGAEVADRWLGLDPNGPSLGVSWAGVDPAPVWFDAARDLSEYWLHEQQIREAVGAPLRNDPPTLRRMLDIFVRGLPFALAAVPAPDDTAGVLRTSGQLDHRWVLRHGRGRWWLIGDEPAESTSPLLEGDEPGWEVLVDADDLWRRWIRHPDAARLVVRTAGDATATTAVIDHVAIVRSPDN